MQLILSSKGVKLPVIYYISDDKDLVKLPLGIPFLRGKKYNYKNVVRILEFEAILKAAKATGLKFNWWKLLKENGFTNFRKESLAFSSRVIGEESEITEKYLGTLSFKDYKKNNKISNELENDLEDVIKDVGSYVVDLEVLKSLNIIPTFLKEIEEAIKINIYNSFAFNPTLYNKKYGFPLGEYDRKEIERSLIIIDISGSIPKSISSTILSLAKTMSLNFGADLLITGSKSTLYEYDKVDELDVTTIYTENGTDNDQAYFLKIVSEEYRKYNTVIVFGDNHSPCRSWRNEYNKYTKYISKEQGKSFCKWEIGNIISFHTTKEDTIAGYADWFDCEDVTYMKNWVTYFE